MTAPAAAFDARELRQVLGSFVTGVTVITTVDAQGKPHGLTVNSFSSVSLDPPLILWSQSLTAPSHPVFRDAERFVVNILADDQVQISNQFARARDDKFAGCEIDTGIGGVPLIRGSAAYLECRRMDSFRGGDHMVFLGQVERIERTGRHPLVFGGGRYLVAQAHDLGSVLSDSGPNIARLQAVRVATRALVELSDELDETLGLGVWGNHGPTIVRWEEAKQPVSDNLRTGLVLPVLTSATGLAFAAWLPPELTEPLITAEAAALGSDNQVPRTDGLQQRLAEFRNQGFVRLVGIDDFADLYGGSISALSVPVFDPDGAMVLALTAIGASDRLDTSESGKVVTGMRRCADTLTQRLRGNAPPQP
jgi:flavin reductase (DIM6/NTAB) family NADH-FMN oxidoreductase RutF/DNA-binding IclR family transcriptional regulator